MSLFQERQASAKKVVALQNEILSLKMQLQEQKQAAPKDCENCKTKNKEISSLQKDLERALSKISQLENQLADSTSDSTSKKKGRKSKSEEA